nr:hypothetical protein [Butyricicoccus sp. OF30-11pH9A]
MEKRTQLTPDETLMCTCCFYRSNFGAEPDEDKISFISKTVENGLTIAELLDAIKLAVAQVGEGGTENDYWLAFRRFAREAWRKIFGT